MYDATLMAYSMTPTPTLSCAAFDLFAQGGFMALIRHIADADYYIRVLSIFSQPQAPSTGNKINICNLNVKPKTPCISVFKL